MTWQPADKPNSLLGYHRILSPTAGVRVSPLCLGTMNFGEAWKETVGECDKDTSLRILDFFFEHGGNFIDTASNYQNEETEVLIGEWLAKRQIRDQIVLATKFTSTSPSDSLKIKTNHQGNHSKNLRISLETSLKKLQTSYIDLLYVHWWDFSTSIPELMQSLHHMVAAGKVLYLGISDTPAWIVSKANEYARQKGLTQFSVYQGYWNAALRDFERDIIPMCEAEGMALAPWGALGRGMLVPPAEFEKKNEGRTGTQPDYVKKVAIALDEIARKKWTKTTSIALAYVMHKSPYVFPIVGGRKVEHLKSNIEALSIELSDDEMDAIDNAAPFSIGFPLNFLFERGEQKYNSRMTTKDILFMQPAGSLDTVQKTKPPKPRSFRD